MKTQKGNIAAVALIIVIVAITAGTMGWMFARETQAPVAQTQPAVKTTTPATQPTAPVDETAGWRTYTNTQYGFEFKYPQSLDLKTADDNCSEVPALECHGFEIYIASSSVPIMTFGVDELGSALITQDADSYESLRAEIIKSRVTISNSNGIIIYKHVEYRGDGKTIYNVRYSMNKSGTDFFEQSNPDDSLYDGYVYFSSSDYFDERTSDSNFQLNQKTAEQILSTFKFTK